MAIAFARLRYIQRSNGGNVCRSAAYNARSDLYCERTGERFFFAHRDGMLHHEILLPEGADPRFADMAILWNTAQAAEKRKDAQEAREVLLALPNNPDLGLDDWREMAAGFASEQFVSKGVAVQIDIHGPHEGDGPEDDKNVHAHILVTTRRIEGASFAATKARDLDPEVRTLSNGKQAVTEAERWGALWRDYQNAYFEGRGLDIRVDEIGIVPQRHEGPERMRTRPEAADARAAEIEAANAAAARDPIQLLEALTRNRATFTPLDIERRLRKYVPEASERDEIRAAVLALPQVVALHDRASGEFAGRYTTLDVRSEERDVLAAADRIGVERHAVAEYHAQVVADARGLDDEQRAAFLKATGTDGFVVIEGMAGTGKSHSLTAIREAHEASGWRVVGLAPTNVVAEDLRRSGFGHGSTVHLELFWQENGRADRAPAWDRRTLVMVDEAAMLDTRIYGRLMRHAAETGAKVILAGDDRQLSSVERGGMFTALKEQHGSSQITRVRRQEQDWQRAASEDFAGGRVAEGLRAYAERGHVHWSRDLDESRTRLLSDWDQDSRERPAVNRFVYASTNVEVDKLNLAIRDIRARRGEIADELTVATVRGTLEIGAGDRIQFHGNDRRIGIYNGSLATVASIDNGVVTAQTDTGREIRFDPALFNQFGLGYAGTVYRGQGKTQTDVYALYDNAFAWNARTAYVGLTRHKAEVELYVSRDLAADEIALGKQMARRMPDEASLAWATEAEIIELRRDRTERGGGGIGASDGRFPREQAEALRRLDLAAYARDAHGYSVAADQGGSPDRHVLTRAKPEGGEERLSVRRADDGHWTFINSADPRDRGDIIDLARREGAADLTAAREAVAAWAARENEAMRSTNRRQQAEARQLPEIDTTDPDRVAKQGIAENERNRAIIGAEAEDRLDALGAAFEQREAERIARLDEQAREANQAEQRLLQEMERLRPQHHEAFVAATEARAAEARRAVGLEPPERGPASAQPQAQQAIGLPTPAQLRQTEALARHYDGRNPYGSLARASLAEAAAFQRDRHALDQRIVTEVDPARRDALVLRRDIEHADHMAQAYTRIADLSLAVGGDAHRFQSLEQRGRAADHREQGAEARREWEARGVDNPALYPALDRGMEQRREQARVAREPAQEQQREPDPPAAPQPAPARSPQAEAQAMRQLDLPAYAAERHGFEVEWRNEQHTRAILRKGGEQLLAVRGERRGWSFENMKQPKEQGDILGFEARQSGKGLDAARETLRPVLDRVEREVGRLDLQRERDRELEP